VILKAAFLLLVAATLHAANTPLSVFKPSISDMEDAPAVPPTFTFVPGQFVFLSFQIDGYKVSPERQIKVSYKVDALDPKGVRLMETIESNVDTTLADEDKNWKPKVRHQVLLPPLGGSGMYKIAISLHDDLSRADASQELKFEVRGRDVAPSETLVIRDFRFYRGEEDREPLATSAYKPGDTVWARFDIAGHKFGPKNSIDLDYGVAVLGPGGKVLFTQEKGDEEKSSSFYPKAYVPCSMNLSLQKNIQPGQYTIAVTARDHIGKQTFETKQNFTVE
jgi:hypothetical protein